MLAFQNPIFFFQKRNACISNNLDWNFLCYWLPFNEKRGGEEAKLKAWWQWKQWLLGGGAVKFVSKNGCGICNLNKERVTEEEEEKRLKNSIYHPFIIK